MRQGNISGTFSNGALQTLAQVMLAEFANPGGLMRTGDNAYHAFRELGDRDPRSTREIHQH